MKKMQEVTIKCHGGPSFNCQHHEHTRKTEYSCRTCRTYLGCAGCAQNPQELVCLRCHDWALNAGEREHGKMIRPGNPAVKKFIESLGEKIIRDVGF